MAAPPARLPAVAAPPAQPVWRRPSWPSLQHGSLRLCLPCPRRRGSTPPPDLATVTSATRFPPTVHHGYQQTRHSNLGWKHLEFIEGIDLKLKQVSAMGVYGAVAFIRSVSIEAVGLGVHLAAGAYDMLLKTENTLTAVPPPLTSYEAKRIEENIRANQPGSAQEGMKKAYESLTDGIGRTASALIGNPIKVYNRGDDVGSALATTVCGAPAAAVAPVSASARALHYALLGLRNSWVKGGGGVGCLKSTDSRKKFIWEEMSYLERWWRDAPRKKQEAFAKLVRDGQLEIVSGGWVMNDEVRWQEKMWFR
ncbi:hypothetical protein ABZP36_008762 [Zizania latifolia]